MIEIPIHSPQADRIVIRPHPCGRTVALEVHAAGRPAFLLVVAVAEAARIREAIGSVLAEMLEERIAALEEVNDRRESYEQEQRERG